MERAKILSAFERGEFPLLLATDIAARGLDIDDLPYVIHADIPNEDGYIHRSGRTGRAGKEGTVLSLVTPMEESKLQKNGQITRNCAERGRLFRRKII